MELEALKSKLLFDITLKDGTTPNSCFVLALPEDEQELKAFICTIQTYSFYCRPKSKGNEYFKLSTLLYEEGAKK